MMPDDQAGVVDIVGIQYQVTKTIPDPHQVEGSGGQRWRELQKAASFTYIRSVRVGAGGRRMINRWG